MMLGFTIVSAIMAILWCALQNSVTVQNLVVGFVLGAIIALALGERGRWQVEARDVFNLKKIYNLANYLVHLGKEIILSNIKVTKLILAPKLEIRPGIVALPADVQGDIPVTLLGNSITLTPGTITLLISEDQNVLYVHALDIEDPEQTKAEIKESLEKYILRLEDR